MGLGMLHFWLITTGRESRWHRFVFAGVDVSIICAIAVFAPLSTLGDVPQIFVFRVYTIAYLMVFLAVSTLSLSPMLVLWTGLCQVLGVWIAFGWIVSGMERTVTWKDLPAHPLRIQPVDATIWLNISAGVWKSRVFLGRSFSCLATAFSLACE